MDAKSEEINILSSKEEEDDEEEESPTQGKGKKRAAPADAGKAAPRRRLNLPAHSDSSSEHSFVVKPMEKPLAET